MSLSATHQLAYPYRRTTGPVIGAFLGGLSRRRILGSRFPDGQVVVPAAECHPMTGAGDGELVEVADSGVVLTTVTMAGEDTGWALIRLDGATGTLLHRARADAVPLQAGARVRALWIAEPVGGITDIEAFVTTTDAPPQGFPRDAGPDPTVIEQIEVPVALNYTYSAGQAVSRFMSAIAQGRILGQRCPVCGMVYVPPTGSCAVDGVPTTEDVELTGDGQVMSFTVVNVPFHGQKLDIPYVLAWIKLDGADIPFPHLVNEIDIAEVEIGLRVRPRWVPDDERRPDFASIRWFRPIEGSDTEGEEA